MSIKRTSDSGRKTYSTFSLVTDARTDDEPERRGSKSTNKIPSFLGLPIIYWKELYAIFDYAWTIMANNTAVNMIPTLSLMFSGKLGVDELGAVGLGNTILVVVGTRQTAGLSTACDTCFAQTFGSSRKKDMGIYFQKSLMILGLFVLPCWAVHINAEALLRLLDTDPHVAYLAGRYLMVTLPVLVAHVVYWVIFKYVRCQGFLIAPMLITVFGLLVNVGVQYAMVNVLDLRTTGSALANLLNFAFLAASMLVWWFASGVYKPTWSGWSMDAFQDWGMFYSLAVAGMLMVQLQWWGFELGTLTASLLGKIALGAQSIVFQVENISYMVPNAIGIAANIRIGQQLGADNPNGAKRSVQCAFGVIGILSLLVMTILLSIRTYIPTIFTNDSCSQCFIVLVVQMSRTYAMDGTSVHSDVIEMATELITILAFYNLFDGICAGSAGMLRGCGKQHEAALVVFIGMYVVGLPISFCLMFLTDTGMAGYWYGLTVALVLEAVMYIYIIFRIDWNYQAKQAQERSKVAKSKFTDQDGETGETEGGSKAHITIRHPVCTDESQSEDSELLTESVKQSKHYLTGKRLFRRRLLTLIGFLLPLIAGVLCRLYVPLPYGCVRNYDNSSLILNGTMVIVSDNTTWPVCL